MAQIEKPFKRRRPRDNPTHRWTESETTTLLDTVVDDVKENPELYEKPTAQKYHQKIATKSECLEKINWECIKSKMRYLKGTYMTAVNWRSQTGAGLLANGEEKSLGEYIDKICPHFQKLMKDEDDLLNLKDNEVEQTIKEGENNYNRRRNN